MVIDSHSALEEKRLYMVLLGFSVFNPLFLSNVREFVLLVNPLASFLMEINAAFPRKAIAQKRSGFFFFCYSFSIAPAESFLM